MASDTITLSDVFPLSTEALFDAWLDSKAHTAFTGAKAKIEGRVGGRYTAWDGYIEGETRPLLRPGKIVQTWRSAEFKPEDADSLLVVTFKAEGKGTRITFTHSDIPDNEGKK